MPFSYKKKTPAQQELDLLFVELKTHETNSKEYAVVLDRIASIHKLTEEEKPKRVSPDTLVMAATNLLGIIAILRYERLDVITTKALGFIARTR